MRCVVTAASGKSQKKWNIWNGDRLPSLLTNEIYIVPKKQAVA